MRRGLEVSASSRKGVSCSSPLTSILLALTPNLSKPLFDSDKLELKDLVLDTFWEMGIDVLAGKYKELRENDDDEEEEQEGELEREREDLIEREEVIISFRVLNIVVNDRCVCGGCNCII